MYQDKGIGIPIPIAYDENGRVYPIPKSMLRLELPENIDLNVKGNHLIIRAIGEINIDGKKLFRGVLDTIYSSWYYLRFVLQKLNMDLNKMILITGCLSINILVV